MKYGMMFVLVSSCGLAIAADGPRESGFEVGRYQDGGRVYFNVGTGERLISFEEVDVQAGADGEAGREIWVVGGEVPCPGMGSSSSMYFILDDYGTDSQITSPMLLDWADITMDTVVDCVMIHWVTTHQDEDMDSDGFADGVEGFGATWAFYDGMNGRSPQLDSIALPLIEFSFYGLPGNPSDALEVLPVMYTSVIDLGSFPDGSLVFEIGDTDSDLQGAAVHNARMDLNDADGDGISDIDPDEDGFADWGWTIDYTQPGTIDVDNADGDFNPSTGIDGDPQAAAVAGVAFGMPPGDAHFDEDADAWGWAFPGGANGVSEDAYGLFLEDGSYEGPLDFGGFSCDPYVPWADFAITLYGPGNVTVCPADLNSDDQLDFFDISSMLAQQVDYNGDTGFDFFDISAFLADYSAGCDLSSP